MLGAYLGFFLIQFPHPFRAVEAVNVEKLRASTARVMALDETAIAQLISEKAPIHLVGCPACGGGAQDTGANVWTLDDPRRVACRYCGLKFPNERYPLNGELKVMNPRGQAQVYRYYDGGSEKRRYFFEGAAQQEINRYMAARAYDLARLYWATKDVRCAQKAALILDRFAQVYPGWPVNGTEGNYSNWKKFYASPPYPVQSGKWGRWIHDELPEELALAYDLVHDAVPAAARKRIEQDLFREAVALVRAYPRYLGASGMNGTAAGLIAIGRAIEEPDFVQDGIARFRDTFAEQFFRDGMYHSGSPAYLLQMVRALADPIEMARGYADLEGANAMYERARQTLVETRLPDGRYTPVHDSWARNRSTQAEPLSASHPVLLPAYGHAVLGRGKGQDQVQAQLHFGYHGGHAHADELNLLLFAKGRELLADLGYTHTKLRPWATSTLAHNTVVVDRQNQVMTQGWIPASWARLDRFETGGARAAGPVFGNLLLYDAAHDHVQVVEAEAARAYPGVAEYRRLIALVPVSETDAYVVDIFRVRGGGEHVWAAHGSADADQLTETSVKLAPRDGTLLGPGTRYSAERDPELDSESFKGTVFGLIDGLSSGSTTGPWSATWRFREAGTPGLKLTMLGGAQRKITVGQAPSILRAGEDNRRVDEFKMPLLLVEASGAESVFVAVWEPFSNHPFISRVDPIEGGIAVQIGNRTDYILADPDGRRLHKTAGLEFQGRFAIVSEVNGSVQFMHLSDGVLLKKGAREIRGAGAAEGRIAGISAEGFETEGTVPPVPGGQLLLVRGGEATRAYRIARVAGRTIVVADGSGLRKDGDLFRSTWFPEWQGALGTFRIPNVQCSAP